MNAPSRPAAIMGQLVDAKNVAQHKCLRLTIDVPAEQAMHVIETLGWPTQVSPVPVAVARLTPQAAEAPAKPAARKPVAPDKRLAQQAAIACSKPKFWCFLGEITNSLPSRSADDAASAVRFACGVDSRSEIVDGTPAGDKWEKLYGQFLIWEQAL